MTALPTVKTCARVVSEYSTALKKVQGKPQKLSVVNGYVYWTQGVKQELFRAPLAQSDAEAQRVIVSQDTDVSSSSTAAEVEVVKLSREEELLRERTRSRVTGITSYRVRRDDDTIFFVSGAKLYIYYQRGSRAGQAPIDVFAHLNADDQQHFAAMGGKPNLYIQHVVRPGDAGEDESEVKGVGDDEAARLTTVSFVNADNLYLAEIHEATADDDGGLPLQVVLTQVTHIGDELHQCGVAEYIIQEEFDRLSGHETTSQYILFSYTDATGTRQVTLINGNPANPHDGEEVEQMAYPRVGDANARCTLVLYERASGVFRVLPPTAILAAAPWVEYIPRFGFKDAETIYLTVLSRDQTTYAVLSCPVSSLPKLQDERELTALYSCAPDAEDKTVGALAHDASGVTCQVEWCQSVPWAWVEVLPGAPILYGTRHDLLLCHAVEDAATAHFHLRFRVAGGDAKTWQRLTSGAWNVKPGTVQRRPRHNRLTFLANADGRLKSVLYMLSFPSDAEDTAETAPPMTRLSALDEHVYSYVLHDNDVYYVASKRTQPAQLYRVSLSPKIDTAPTLQQRHQIALQPWLGELPTLSYPTVERVTNRRGVALDALVFVSPTAPSPGPLVLFVYGGPHVQLVAEDDYEASCRAVVQVLLQFGVSVAVVDNQMSNANGLRQLSICKRNMGGFETDDYVDMTNYLCSRPAEAGLPASVRFDASRVAIFGWSYGGYATLLAMCQAAKTFKMGFAGAPVGDWRLYDTGYTERYMGPLYEVDETGKQKRYNSAYDTSCIRHFAGGFPDEPGRVYIAHGMLDENVHFSHTCHVINALVDECKPYVAHIYPGERHGLRQNEQSRIHYEALMISAILRDL